MDKIASIYKAEFCSRQTCEIHSFFPSIDLFSDKSKVVPIHSSSFDFSEKRDSPGNMVEVELKIKITDITTKISNMEGLEGLIALYYTNGSVKILGSFWRPIVFSLEKGGLPEVTYLVYKSLQPFFSPSLDT